MLNYSNQDIHRVLTQILNSNDFSINPVGNHHLKRHLVYEITFKDGKKYIFKIYYKLRRRAREIASLTLLEKSQVRCPKLVKYGEHEGHEWLMTEYMEGVLLDHVLSNLTHQNKLQLFNEIGQELGKLHEFKTFESFGEWDQDGNFIKSFSNYYDYFTKGIEDSHNIILNNDIPDQDLLIKAIQYMKDHDHVFNQPFTPRLTHNDFDGRNILVKKVDQNYHLSGIIDFEGSYPKIAEEDFIGLYYRYFLKDKDYEEAFIKGYEMFLKLEPNFKERLKLHLLSFAVGNCSWAYDQAPSYYEDNIKFLKTLI